MSATNSALETKQSNGGTIKDKSHSQSSVLSAPRKPEFFLYTRLGQNETKNLKKAATNRDERKVLAQIFELKTLTGNTSFETPDKVEILRLDFHYINYNFCKENYFSNEKTSTLLAMLEAVLNKMLERQLTPQQGFNMLRQYLMDHSIQRPPFSILIFSAQEVQSIQEFALETFLRHFSLYEFAFNPRVELILRTDPVINSKFNAAATSLDEMEPVDKQETERLKAFLGLGDFHESAGDLESKRGSSAYSNHPAHDAQKVASQHLISQQQEEAQPNVDWAKVGKVYKEDTALQTVFDREFNRLNKALEVKLQLQDEKIATQPLGTAPGAPGKK